MIQGVRRSERIAKEVPRVRIGSDTEGKVFSADGVEIHYRSAGTGSTALVFVHGWLGNAHWWDGQLKHFSLKYQIVEVDLINGLV